LSSDSEIVALRAAGASVYRIVIPVVVFSVCIAGATFVFNEKVVPVALARYQELQSHLIKTTKMKAAFPISRSLIEKQRLQAFICAENINPASQTLQGVTMIAYDEKGKMAALMFADKLDFKTKDEWVARGNVRIVPADFSTIIRIPDEVWPSQIPKIHQSFLQITAERDDDFDSMTLMQLRSAIIFHKQQGDKTPDVLHNYEYGYWTKIAVPMAAITFGVLGAVLGIRNHRTGTAAGFALAVAIIFGYVTLANFMNVWAIGGVIPAWMAAFAPLVVGAMAALVILWQRNG
jgi:lipopolysaccharide export system permease protein